MYKLLASFVDYELPRGLDFPWQLATGKQDFLYSSYLVTLQTDSREA